MALSSPSSSRIRTQKREYREGFLGTVYLPSSSTSMQGRPASYPLFCPTIDPTHTNDCDYSGYYPAPPACISANRENSTLYGPHSKSRTSCNDDNHNIPTRQARYYGRAA